MKKLFINSIADIAEFMYEKILETCEEVTFIGLYEDAVDVLKELSMIEETYPYQISIEPEEWDGYNKEFLVTLGEDFDIWCEKAYRVEIDSYVHGLMDCVLIADDCDKEALRDVDEVDVYVVSYAENEKMPEEDICECDCNCECCKFSEESEIKDEKEELLDESSSESTNVSRTKDGRIAGFTKSWSNTDANGTHYYSSYSHYGNNEEAVKRLAREFGIDV